MLGLRIYNNLLQHVQALRQYQSQKLIKLTRKFSSNDLFLSQSLEMIRSRRHLKSGST